MHELFAPSNGNSHSHETTAARSAFLSKSLSHSICLHLLAPLPSSLLCSLALLLLPLFLLSLFFLSRCPSVSLSLSLCVYFLGSDFILFFLIVQLREIGVITDIVLPRDIVLLYGRGAGAARDLFCLIILFRGSRDEVLVGAYRYGAACTVGNVGIDQRSWCLLICGRHWCQ